MNRRAGRLRAEGLARLMAVVAGDPGLAGMCEALIGHSRRGTWLRDQLQRLGQQVGEGFSWSHLAELLATVDRLAERLEEWPLQVVQMDLKRLPLAYLHAAAQLRCRELLPARRAAHRELLRLLGEEIGRERKVAAPEEGEGEDERS